MNIQTLINEVEALRETNQKRYNEAMDKEVFSKFEKYPTVDKDGRLHAPVDNYEWVDGVIYLGGMYLPDPYAEKFDLIDFKKSTLTYKMKVNFELVEQLIKLFPTSSNGKTWTEDSIQVCYFSKSELKLLTKIFPQVSGKRIVKVSEFGNPSNSKTWKFSSKRIWNKAVSMNLDTEFLAPGVEIRIDLNGNASSDFDKQEVRYDYFKPETLLN